MLESAERRRYPRVLAPVYYRPAGPAALHHRRAAQDVSLGGMRVYSDDELTVGMPLDVELVLDEGSTARCWARIAWVEVLPPGAGAAYDVGLEFVDMADDDRTRLGGVLENGQI